MRLYNKELQIQQGEEFSIDWEVVQENGDPYIVSAELHNPKIQIAVTSAKYSQGDRYVHNYYLDIPYTFYSTTPYQATAIGSKETGGYPSTVIDVKMPGETIFNTAVFKLEDGEYYSVTAYDDATSRYTITPYDFRIVKVFSTEDTKQWTEHDYLYSINIVAGQTTEERLIEIKSGIDGKKFVYDDKITDMLTLYEELKKYDRKLVKDIRLDKFFYNINYKQVIVEPTKLTVTNDLFGGSY